MPKFNLSTSDSIEKNYERGLLPQRNNKDKFYFDSSSRSNLADFSLSSENKRIINKTENFAYKSLPLSSLNFDLFLQKQLYKWIKELDWSFPISSVKIIFNNHIFNHVDIWYDKDIPIAYLISYIDKNITHAAYLFYDSKYSHGNLPIRIVLQFVIDSQKQDKKYCYLGRFSKEIGFYKRNMPNFEYFKDNQWLKY
ncbi:MAG: hypothetical protein WAV41_04350 [Microgenomates group bacterium]